MADGDRREEAFERALRSGVGALLAAYRAEGFDPAGSPGWEARLERRVRAVMFDLFPVTSARSPSISGTALALFKAPTKKPARPKKRGP